MSSAIGLRGGGGQRHTLPKSRLKRLFYTKYGQLLLSCLLGLGLATVFRRACRSGNCVVHKVPSRSDMANKVYKEDGSCFKVSLNEAECDQSKKGFVVE